MNNKPYRKANYNGMNWISQVKRLAIYLRDGLSCCYCSEGVEDGAKLTLDHVVAVLDGGSNDATNLVTACFRCNSSKGTRTARMFAKGVAAYVNHGVTADQIMKHVRKQLRTELPKAEAKALIEKRGSAAKVLAAHKCAC